MLKNRSFITLTLLAIWFLSIHHCVFEYFLQDFGKVVTSQSSESSDNECRSHDSKNTESHNEGQPCNANKVSVSDKFAVNVKLNLVPMNILFTGITNEISELKEFNILDLETNAKITRVNYPLESLSGASNAPPLLA